MKQFTVQCDFGGKSYPVSVYIGEPRADRHPLQYQAHWLSNEKGGVVPASVMDSFSSLLRIAHKNHVSFEELAMYAMNTANEEKASDLLEYIDDGVLCFKNAQEYVEKQKKLAQSGKQKFQQYKDSITRLSSGIKDIHSLFLYEEEEKQLEVYWKVANYFFPLAHEHVEARMFLFAILGYLGADTSKPVTLTEVFNTIANEDLNYNLAVIVDCIGAYLPEYSYRIFLPLLIKSEKAFLEISYTIVNSMIQACLEMRPLNGLPMQEWLQPLRENFLK